ncbi:hypothetical protein GGX14DRAFT_346266 [Mycena pura]|uniref:Dicer-like protein 1 n=1 Tax=Mycena pura TaxID=153505 RepID=A0AAD7E5F0_9AGAR|nr:hypothetical protein GGX14DRAFT_346266 [Mycena pura]
MNKVWKKKWRGQQAQSGGLEYLGGSGSSVSPVGSSEPVPPVDFPLPALPPAPSETKRLHVETSLDPGPAPPLKKVKTDNSVPLEPDRAYIGPQELVLLYDKTHGSVETELLRRIRSWDTSEAIFRRYFVEARRVQADVGSCAADLVWRRALKNIDIDDTFPSADDEYYGDEPTRNLNRAKFDIKATVKNWAFTMPNLDPNSRSFNVTPKFLRLVQILKSCEAYDEEFRGIVFVRRRATASAISDLITMLGEHVGFIHAFVFTRQGSLRENDKEQQEIFRKFKLGIYNLLISTKSVEDLDIPRGMIVIRFDLFEGDLSYAFLRSLAAGKESHLVHMLERGNEQHRRNLLSTSVQRHPDMTQWLNTLGFRLASVVPPLPLNPSRSEQSDSEDEPLDPSPITEPITGGRIYLQDATAVVYRLATMVNTNPFPSPLFDYNVWSSGSNPSPVYTCTVLLPGTPAHNISGRPCSSEAHARRSACYNVCVRLSEAGLLDPAAFPLPRFRSETQESSRLIKAQDPNDVGVQIHPRKTPAFWSTTISEMASLFPTVITVKLSNQPRHAPILLLTHKPLAEFPSFKLFFSGTPATIETYNGAPFKIDREKSIALHLYTLRLCRAVANKPFTCTLANMTYFLAPLSPSWVPSIRDRWQLPDVLDHIPWDLVFLGADSWCVPLKYGRAEDVSEDIQDAVILDRSVELTRRYDVLRVRPDLSPLSHPEDSPREAEYASLLDYCKAVRKNFAGLQDERQALIEVSSVMVAVSRLDPASRPSMTMGPPPPRYLIPELCLKFSIPASTFRTALLFPSISRRLDSFLLVKELNARFFNHQISENLLDMAITTPSTRMEYDYERLELLGDAFLKYLASIYVFVNEPSGKEGALHLARQHIISNQTLFSKFDSVGLPLYIQANPFGIKSWQPPNFETSETASKFNAKLLRKENEQRLGDKVVADVAEAILGAAYMSGGNETALMAAKAMNLPFHNIAKWSDFRRKLLIPPPKITAKLKPGALESVETMINCKVKHPHLLAQALTHASVSAFERVSYERLEFLGDAILEFLIVRHIFERNRQLLPGSMTVLKGAMASNSALAAVCISSGLYKHLLLATSLYPVVANYMEKLRAKQTEEYELARAEKRNPGQYWQEIESPKVLSDVVESVIGAIYVSDDMAAVEALFNTMLKPFYDKHITLKTVAHHPTKILFELVQTKKCQKFQIVKEQTSHGMHCHIVVHDVILASGEGTSTSLAARNASWCALDALEGDADFLRICDCATQEGAKGHSSKNFDEMLSRLEE